MRGQYELSRNRGKLFYKVYAQLNLIAQDKFSRNFNINEAGEGIYFIRIATDSEILVKKLVTRE